MKSYPGVNCFFNDLDMLIVRENTEGLYSGMEEYTYDGATALRVVTRSASERICRFAFKYAEENCRNKITVVHKANVLKKTDGIFRESFFKVLILLGIKSMKIMTKNMLMLLQCFL